LSVDARDFIAIFEYPLAVALRLVVVKVTFEVAAIRVLPLAGDHLTFHELANKFLTSLRKDISSLSVLLTVQPVP